MEQIINTQLNNNNYVYFSTNGPLSAWDNIDSDCKAFMRNMLTPRPEFQEYINEKISTNPYTLIHMRLGDSYLLDNITNDFSNKYNLLTANSKSGDILISDSKKFKDFVVVKNADIKMFSTVPGHIGLSTDDTAVRDTLFEFIIASKATLIKTYSGYGWISGFMTAAHKIFDVPLIQF